MMAACGGNGTEMLITPQNTTDIYSPNYPDPYPNNIICRWHIKVEKNFGIELQINRAELEEK